VFQSLLGAYFTENALHVVIVCIAAFYDERNINATAAKNFRKNSIAKKVIQNCRKAKSIGGSAGIEAGFYGHGDLPSRCDAAAIESLSEQWKWCRDRCDGDGA